jgi:hypothetical protein
MMVAVDKNRRAIDVVKNKGIRVTLHYFESWAGKGDL